MADETTSQPQAPIAGSPEGLAAGSIPVGAVLFDSNRTGNFEIFVMEADADPVQLTSDTAYDSWWARVSPDRSRIVFTRTPAGVHDTDYSQTSLWMMAADGSDLTELRPSGTDGWYFQGHPEWSPDGEHLALLGGSQTNPQIFVTTSLGTEPRQLTDRPGTNIDPSWSPDGQTIAFIGCPQAVCYPEDYEVYLIDSAGEEEARRITNNGWRDHDPYFSPDGSMLAWLTQTSKNGHLGEWSIQITEDDFTKQRFLINDGAINSYPAWDSEGSYIYFHRLTPGDMKFEIFRIRPDGTGLTQVTVDQPGVNEHPDIAR